MILGLDLKRDTFPFGDSRSGVITNQPPSLFPTIYLVTLERQSKLISVGLYKVVMTKSQRSLDGKLWTPDPDHRLPLLESVPGRSGIRIHAANRAHQLEGCIAVGTGKVVYGSEWTLSDSRRGLTQFINLITQASETWLRVE